MIVDDIKNIEKYSSIIPIRVIDFMKTLSSSTPAGHYKIDDNNYANVDEYKPKPIDSCKFEAHKKYIDIQMVLEGEEQIHITNTDLQISEEYNTEKDIMFFVNTDNNVDKIDLKPFKFVFIYPNEAHKPQIKTSTDYIKKVVVKIAV